MTLSMERPGDLIGQQVGGSYRIVSVLGEGGCGMVYQATSDLMAGKRAAVKVLHAEIERRPEGVSRFYAEVYAAGKLADPNIVDVFDAGRLRDGRLYMIMELCDGGSLDALLRERGPLPIELAFAIALCVGQALHAAHESKITHRDIKPANILLVREPGGVIRAKLSDFGIAKLHDPQLLQLLKTGTKTILGSPGYMSPEQCRVHGAGEVDHRSDIYAFASVLYQMVTGRRPYLADTPYALIEQVAQNAPIPRPRDLRPDLPVELEAVILAGLEYRPEQRIQSIKEMVLRLARVVRDGEALLSFFAPRLVEASTAPTAATISEGIGPAAAKWASAHSTLGRSGRRSRTLGILAAGMFAGAAIPSLVLVLRDRPRDPPARGEAPLDAATASHDAASALATAGEVAAPPVAIAIDAGLDAAPRDVPPAPVRAGTPTAPVLKPRAEARLQVAEKGAIEIFVSPWAEVTIDGVSYGQTPVQTKLVVGNHRVSLKSPTNQKTMTVTVTGSKKITIDETW